MLSTARGIKIDLKSYIIHDERIAAISDDILGHLSSSIHDWRTTMFILLSLPSTRLNADEVLQLYEGT